MNKPDRILREIGRRVMKTRLPGTPATSAAAAEAMQRSCGELYRILETAMGPHGLQALVDRAIQITVREYPWLATVRSGTAADCPLSGLAEAVEDLDVADAAEGYAALLASILAAHHLHRRRPDPAIRPARVAERHVQQAFRGLK